MPRDKLTASPDEESALAKARKAIADTFALFGAATLNGGMATVVAYSLFAITSAGGLANDPFTQFGISLTANWLSQMVWSLRGRMARQAANPDGVSETVRQLSMEVVPHLSDSDLSKLFARLEVIEATLRAAEAAQVDPGPLISEMLRVGLATKEDINAAVARIRPSRSTQTQINTAINSSVITFVGDNNTVNLGETEAQRREAALLEEVKMHRAQLVRRHAPLDLRGLDIAAQASAGGGRLKLKLEDVYTPLFTRRLVDRSSAESWRRVDADLRESTDSFTPIPQSPKPPSRFRLLFDTLFGTQKQRNEATAASVAPDDSARELYLAMFPRDDAFGRERPDRISILEALNDAPHAVVLGKGGSGKSTVLKHIVLGLCGEVDEFEREWRHGDLLPIWVTLREFVDDAHARSIRPCENAEDEKTRREFNRRLQDEPAEALIDFVIADLKRADSRGKQALPHLAQNLETWLSERGGVFLLDGLDEVPSALRFMVRQSIRGLAERFPRCRFIVTCRPYSYRDEQDAAKDRALKIAPGGKPFAELDVLPLDMPQIGFFVRHWYVLLADLIPNLSLETANQRSGELVAQIKQDERLRVLAETPLLLTLIGSLHGLGNRRLPNERWELLKQTVDLLLVSWQQIKRQDSDAYSAFDLAEGRIHAALEPKRGEALLTQLHELAYIVHAGATTLDPSAASDITERQLMAALRNVLPREVDVKDEDLAQYLRDRVGLILDEGGKDGQDHVYRFPHRMFQEYLCACHMRESYFEVAPKIDDDFERWQEVYALLALMTESATFTKTCVETLCPHPPVSAADWRRAELAANIWADFPPLRLDTVLRNARHPVTQHIEQIRAWLLARMSDMQGTPAHERARAGDALARLGDARFDSRRWFLPKGDWLGFTLIEADPDFRIGTRERDFRGVMALVGADEDRYRGEINDALTPTRAFYVARFPVTVAQFRAFVDATKRPIRDEDVLRDPDNRPVRQVDWRTAMAYCAWLETQLKGDAAPAPLRDLLRAGKWRVTLPSELEWEKAARGGLKDASFSWADGPNPEKANYADTRIDTTSTVGCFPVNGYELHDMIGNVWEWTRSVYMPYPYDLAADRQVPDTASDEPRVVRGGAFDSNQKRARCASRFDDRPGSAFGNYGFRVVLSPS